MARPGVTEVEFRLGDVFELLDRPFKHFGFEPSVIFADRSDSLQAVKHRTCVAEHLRERFAR